MVAYRPEGDVVMLTKGMGVKSVRTGVPLQWLPTFGALVSDAWQVVTIAKFKEMIGETAGQGS